MERIKKDTRFLCEIVTQSSKDIPRQVKEFKCLEISEKYIKIYDDSYGMKHWLDKKLFDNKSNYGTQGYFIVEILDNK